MGELIVEQSQLPPSQSQCPDFETQVPDSEMTAPLIESQLPTQSQSQQTQRPWGMLAYLSSKFKHKPNIDLKKNSYVFGKLSQGNNKIDFVFEEEDVGSSTYPLISRSQFKIELQEVKGRMLPYITDLSSNGTYVNGSIIGKNKSRILSHGDILSLIKGNRKFFVFYQLDFQNLAGVPDDITRSYSIVSAIGKGGFGSVYLTIKKETGQMMAMKVIKDTSNGIDPFIEPKLMYEVRHPNVVSIYTMLRIENDFYLFMEYMGGGDLNRYIRERGRLKESITKHIAYQLACGIHELHRLKIVHRDIKPLNILLESTSEYPKVKITDFGLARKMKSELTLIHTICGTKSFTAPELLTPILAKRFDRRVDIWSLGVVIYYCLSGRLPFVEKNGQNADWYIKQACFDFEPIELWQKISPTAIDLIKRMLNRSYLYRPYADSMMSDAWFLRDHQFIQRMGLRKRKENLTGGSVKKLAV